MQGIGHVSEIMDFAKTVAGCESLQGLHFLWRVQWVRTIDAMFWGGRRARFLRRVARFAGTVLLKHVFERWAVCWDRACRARGMRAKCVVWLARATLCGDCACPSHGMLLVNLRFWFCLCSPLLGLCLLIVRNAGKVAFLQLQEDAEAEILHKRFFKGSWWSRRILLQVFQNDLDAQILRQRSCTSAPQRILMQRTWNRNCAQVVLQDPDTSATKGSYAGILGRDFAQVMPNNPGAKILGQRSCTSGRTASCFNTLGPVLTSFTLSQQ